ncbi:MAG: hypothetical protein M3Y59_12060 [Myxococcota bacterium]|nr:hypothetical protein [Myxococcota bacterium]
MPFEDVFAVDDVIVSIGSGSRPDYRPQVQVLDTETLQWNSLDPQGGPPMVVGYSNYSISWFAVGDRLVGTYPLGFAVVDPNRRTWAHATVPPEFRYGGPVVSDYELIFPSHRFDAQRVAFKPSPPALRRLGPHWVPFGRTLIAFDPVSRSGASVSLLTGEERPLSFEGLPALTGHIVVARLDGRRILVIGQSSSSTTTVAGAVYEVDQRRWRAIPESELTFLASGRLHNYRVPDAPGVWLYEPTGPQGPKVLYQLDPETLKFGVHPLPTGISAVGGPNGLYVFDESTLKLFAPGEGEICRWSTQEIPKNSMSGETWTSPGIHGRSVLDASGGLQPFGLVKRIGAKLLVTSDRSVDGNPACPPGASCLPHNPRLVRHEPYSALIEFR